MVTGAARQAIAALGIGLPGLNLSGIGSSRVLPAANRQRGGGAVRARRRDRAPGGIASAFR